ncbi:MAG TPA: DUF1109 domain-containing protein [Ramlibacter sp.]|nr:DUF1109 domain-containing protein [Ramlibacter sp.]
MTTDDLVAALARDAAPVDARVADRQFSHLLAAAAALSLAVVLVFLGHRQDWRSVLDVPMFWTKLAFPAATAAAAAVVLRRLGHPGQRLGAALPALALPALVLWAIAAAVLAQAPDGSRTALVVGDASWPCTLFIAALSVPAFVLALRAARRLAPTRLALTGAAAGLFAGSAAALAYALHCTELQAPFVAAWYVAGMLVPAALGALLGRRLLRW